MSFPCSVVLQGKVYVGGGEAEKTDDEHSVMAYKQGEGWKRLPRYRYRFFAMAVLQDQLTLVGGEDSSTHKVTNQISVWDFRVQRWTYPYPPLCTRRFRPGVATYTKWLVVVGGENDGTYLNSVEIMNTTNKQWFTATPLPMGCSDMTSAIVGDECYFMGGNTQPLTPTKQVLHVSLSAITSEAISQFAGSTVIPAQWYTLPDAPLQYSATLALCGSLLAVGGEYIDHMHGKKRSSAIHLYQPGSRRWVKVGDLPTPRSSCSCTLLHSKEILVVGGFDSSRSSRFDMGHIMTAAGAGASRRLKQPRSYS